MQERDFERFRRSNQAQAKRSLDEFLKKHDTDDQADNVHILEGEAHAVIADFVRRNDVDLVVMGTVGRSGLSGLIMGNTAEQVLEHIECSVLAVKPSSFVCPIRLD